MNTDIIDQNRAVMSSLNGKSYDAEGLAESKAAASERVGQKTLGQAEFFKLLTTQLASQDPLKPMEDTAFIAQMASFSELEMTSQLTSSFQEFTSIQQFSAAQSYIGKTVSLSDGGHGVATAIEDIKGETMVYLDGETEPHSVKQINKVEL